MNRLPLGLLFSVALGSMAAAAVVLAEAAAPSQVVFDFETGDLQGWQVVEGEFKKLICNRRFFFHLNPKVKYNKQGTYYLSTLELPDSDGPDDTPTGVIESPLFLLSEGGISFLVGGGSHSNTYVAVCTEEGEEVFRATGKNDQVMQRITWEGSQFVGRRLFLRIVDRHSGGWGHVTFDDFRAAGRIDREATRRRDTARRRQRLEQARKEFAAFFQTASGQLRGAIEDLIATFAERYPKGGEYLARLDQLRGQAEKADAQQAEKLRAELLALMRQALVANPLVRRQPILLVVRSQYKRDHHNTATMFQSGEINTQSFQGGGAIKTICFDAQGRMETRTLLELPRGVARDPDVSFDGKRVLFSARRDRDDDYHICRINADGSGLEQLTSGSGISDIDPIWLPDGRILFSSTREPKYCMCNRHIMCNLFTMDADGANIQQIGHSTLHEGHASLLPDGRVLYDRWEYVDRNFGDAQGTWTVNPDGTNHAVYYGNNMNSPGAVLDGRIIPGTERMIATFSSCHDRPWGALAIVDRRLAIDGKAAVIRTWPAEAIDLVGKGNYDTFIQVDPKYEDPYPLSDKYFLCSRMTGRGGQMGIWLIDVFGNEILLHAEGPGCFDPLPLAPRRRPPVIPSRVGLCADEGCFCVADVYVGAGMEKIERGTVKWLRVVESPEKRFWTQQSWNGSGTQAPGMAWNDFNNKRILGTVPVEPDGSAYFAVPADAFVYFQLLDGRGMMIQSMRSGTIARPGETTGCIGCHEGRRTATAHGRLPMAVTRPPSRLKPWYGPPRNFSYLAEVQPVFDKHCVKCHDYGQEAGRKLNLAGDLGLVFNTSYVELRSKDYVRVVGAGPADVLPPKSWGSHASPLVDRLISKHDLDEESLDRIVTWIDINAPYCPEYASAYRDHQYGRSPLDPQQLERLSRLTGVNLSAQESSAQLSFTRPELSPAMAKFAKKSDPKYREALAIIRAGQQALARRPRADMPNFKLTSKTEINQEAKYQARSKIETDMRSAISEGRKQYEGKSREQ